MAFHNANYRIIPLSTGANGPFTAQTVHEIYCVANGTATISAVGGGSMTVTMTANQSVKIRTNTVNVASGTFVAFSPMQSNINRYSTQI